MYLTIILGLLFFIVCGVLYYLLMRKYKKIKKTLKWKDNNELTKEVEFNKTDPPINISESKLKKQINKHID